MKSSFSRRAMAVLLALTMCISLAPAVFAADQPTVTITPATVELEIGGTQTLTAALSSPPAVTKTEWSSSNENAASVDSNGLVIAKAEGTATITATCTYEDPDNQIEKTAFGTCMVTVKAAPAPDPVVTVELSPATLSLKVGGPKGKLNAVVKEDGNVVTGKTVTWSGMGSIVDIDANGNVTPKQSGTVSIRASCDGIQSDPCTITVAPEDTITVTDLTLTPDSITMDPREQNRTIRATVSGTNTGTVVPTWESSDESVAAVSVSQNGTLGTLDAKKPGEATITVTAGDKVMYCYVTVSGIVAEEELPSSITLQENGEKTLPTLKSYGSAGKSPKYQSEDSFIARIEGGTTLVGLSIGKTRIRVTDGSGHGRYDKFIDVEVEADPTTTIPESGTIPLRREQILRFGGSEMWDRFEDQLSGGLDRIVGLNVDTTQGTLYYKYRSEAEPGAGVATSETFYMDPGVGQKGISDITFVPKPDFTGGVVTIRYNGISKAGKTYSCKILITVDPGSGNGNSADRISMSTDYNTPVKFNSGEFDRVCQDQTGVRLNYVTFSLPSSREGTLYTNYTDEGNYGSLVTMRSQYSRKDLDEIWFVPAPGYKGTVSIYYTGRATGTNGSSFTGRIDIEVGDEDDIHIGGLAYDTVRGGVAHFDDADFNDYCQDLLSNSKTLSYLQFDSLPSSDQGTLYYDYRSSSSTGTRASTGTSYYYGTRTPRIDRLTFAPAEDFTGTIKLPFTAWATDGTRFTGNVEINVRGGGGYGDIHYTCKPGQRKNFNDSDFNSLCKEVTNDRLNYIVFQGLPDRNREGSLYLNNSRITSTGTSYYYGTSSREIDDLSFRAVNDFSGAVDIPFVGHAVSGETFNGVLTIESSGSSSSGRWEISYTATTKDPAVFKRADFNDLCQWETDRDISSIRFNDIPSRSEGDLYRNYYSTSSKGSRITSTSTSISSSEINRVAFIPASGFTGTVTLGFTAKATNGDTFDGTLEITVERPGADVTVRYSTRVAPVDFRGEDFRRSGSTLSSIRFSSLPPASAGYLYYQYTSPTRYGRQASTGTNYRLNGSDLISDLTFIPRAGFTGTVTLPYTGTNSNNSTFEGEVVITVSPTYSSSHFSDLGSYSDQQRAAVDYLYDNDITKGISSTQYGPEYSITRGDFAVMVYKAFGLSPMGSGRFNDVPSSAYYAQAVNTLSALGIVSGIGGGAYGPDYTLTREDAICMVQRAMRSVGWSANDGSSSSLLAYSDGNSVSGYARGAMANAVQMGYLPTNGGRLDPAQPLTRIDMAQIIHRVLTY